MTPVEKCIARSGANHKNQAKAASRNVTMNAPINTSSCVTRSRTHCNLLGIYFPPLQRGLPRVHWSEEAFSLGFALPYSIPGIKVVSRWIIETMMEAVIR